MAHTLSIAVVNNPLSEYRFAGYCLCSGYLGQLRTPLLLRRWGLAHDGAKEVARVMSAEGEEFDLDAFAAEVVARQVPEIDIDAELSHDDLNAGDYPIHYKMESSSSKGAFYVVTVLSDDPISITCQCTGYSFRHYCKHTKAVQEARKAGTIEPFIPEPVD